MSRFRNSVLLSGAILVATGIVAHADCGMNHQQTSSTAPGGGSMSDSGSGQQTTILGEISDLRMTSTTSQSPSLIRVRLEDGRYYVVDVGPRSNLDRFNLSQGDEVQITGKFVAQGGRQVFKADRLRVDGQSVQIQRTGQQQRSQNMAQQQQRSQSMAQRSRGSDVTVSGTIQGFRHMKVRGSKGGQEVHTLVRLEQDNGRVTVVDLGPKHRLDNLSLKKGERLRVQAGRGTIDGKSMLMANRFALDDRRTQNSQRAQRSSSGQQGQQFTLQGKVQGYQVMRFGSGQQQQVLLNLQLADGRSILVDAGDYQPGELNLQDLDINDQVTIKARRITRGNRQALIADTIQFEQARGGTSEKSDQQSQSSGKSKSQSDSNQ